MNVVTPRLPLGARQLFNALYDAPPPECLTDDLYAASLPGEITIGVGWLPEGDTAGSYEVSVWQGSYENQLVEPFSTADVMRAKELVELIAVALSPPQAWVVSGAASARVGTERGEVVLASGSISHSIHLLPSGR